MKGQNWTVARIHSCSKIPTTRTFPQLLAVAKGAVCGHRTDKNELGSCMVSPLAWVHTFMSWLIKRAKQRLMPN